MPTPSAAQELSLSGFIKAENIYDTRQVAQVREGQFALFPLPRDIDAATGQDLNATDNLLFATFQSRLALTGSGTEVLGAQLSGTIEADFFGAINSDVSEFRLRHAFVKLNWTQHELLLGQYWSPLFTTAVYPGVINFTTGAPFQPFARFPQIRYTYKPGALRIMALVSQQRDAFAEIGGSKLQQQSGLPAAHLHVQRVQGESTIGVGTYLKHVRPSLTSDRFSAYAVQGYAKTNLGERLQLRAKATYGNDLTDHLMTGGFVTNTDGGHSCLYLASGWLDVTTTSQPLAVGLFGGYLVNLGSNEDIDADAIVASHTRTSGMQNLWRVAPRVTYTVGKLRFAAELEATTALYTNNFTDRLRPDALSSDESVTNVRGLFAAYYFF
ncbi:MAG: hypothetical protein AAGI71_08255 [Bacteroidota bacterium]